MALRPTHKPLLRDISQPSTVKSSTSCTSLGVKMGTIISCKANSLWVAKLDDFLEIQVVEEHETVFVRVPLSGVEELLRDEPDFLN